MKIFQISKILQVFCKISKEEIPFNSTWSATKNKIVTPSNPAMVAGAVIMINPFATSARTFSDRAEIVRPVLSH